MTDYFSSLLQQTGIETMPDRDAAETVDEILMEEQSPESHEDEAATPLEVDEQVMIEPPPSDIKESSIGTVPGGPEPEPLAKSKSIPAKSDGRLITSEAASSAPKSYGRSLGSAAGERQEQDLEISGSKESRSKKDEESGSNVPEQEPDKSLQSLPIAKETLTRTPDIETEITKIERVQPLPRSSALPAGASAKTISSSKRISVDKKISREQVLHAVYKEVRSWATAQSALTTEEHQSQVAAEVVNQVRQALPGVIGPGKDAVVLRPQQESQTEKPGETGIATQHFHLSIGPISVSVAEPRREVRNRQPSPRGEARSMTYGRSSRLSRHYVHL
jgi:hypothetical protein